MLETLKQLDQDIFLYLNGIHNPFWDELMYQASGRFIWIPLYIFIVYLIIRKFKKNSYIPILGAVLLIVLSDQLSVHLFKNIFERLRPCRNPEIKDMVHLVHNHCGGLYGFISSHAANTFAMSAFTSLLLRNRLYTIGIYFWAILVSYSRIYLGVHYPGDVFVGIVFGVMLGISIYILVRRILNVITNPKKNL